MSLKHLCISFVPQGHLFKRSHLSKSFQRFKAVQQQSMMQLNLREYNKKMVLMRTKWKDVKFKAILPVLVCSVFFTFSFSYNFVSKQGISMGIEEINIPEKYQDTYNTLVETSELKKKHWKDLMEQRHGEKQSYNLPKAIGIGAKKCGTSALFNFLQWHPRVRVPHGNFIETFFFNTEQYFKGINSYRLAMEKSSVNDVVVEKTPDYFTSGRLAAPRIKQTLPNVKLILMLCDPVDRTYSEYFNKVNHDKGFAEKWPSFHTYVVVMLGKIKRSLESKQNIFQIIKDDPDMTPITNGLYSEYIDTWKQHFNSSQMMIINGEEFLNDPGKILEGTQKFLNIEEILKSEDFITNPSTDMKCLRPWWDDNYDFKREVLKWGNWEDDLLCSSRNTMGTRNNKTPMRRQYPMTSYELYQFYKSYNAEIYKIIDKDFQW